MPSVVIREIRKPEQGEEVVPAMLYQGSRPEFKGMIYTGRNRRTEFQSNADKPSPHAITNVAETMGYAFFTVEVK